MRADEVEDGARALPGRLPQPSPELLEEQRRTVGRAEKEERVDGRDVHALVEQVDREDRPYGAVGQVAERSPALVGTARCRECHGREAELAEAFGHEMSVTDADAVAERPHRRRIGDLPPDLLDHQTRPRVVGSEDVLERSDVVSLSAAPRDPSQVEPVVDSEVRKGCEVLLVDRVPQAQLRRDPAVEVAEDVEAIRALRRRR